MNKYIIGDNIDLLKNIEFNSIDFIYADPPYNTGRDFNDFNDDFESVSFYAFKFMKPILQECKRVLKDDGNILIHVEPKVSHYLRLALDNVFGIKNFKNEIVWCSGGNKISKKQLARFHDTLLVYSKKTKSKYNPLYLPYGEEYKSKNSIKVCSVHNKEYVTTAAHNSQPNVNPRLNLRYEWNGHHKQWYVVKEKMQKLHDDNRLEYSSKGIPRFKKFLEEMNGIPIRDLWTDISQIQSGEKVDYATQKPVKLLERILKIYTNEEDLVLDPFAGSGTTGRACINTNRKYILMDINEKGKLLFEKSLKE